MSTISSVTFLTGITLVGMGAIADDAAALSTTQTQTFEITGAGNSLVLPFAQFNLSSGNLDSVAFELDSVIMANGNPEGFLEASINTDTSFLGSKSGFGIFGSFNFTFSTVPGNAFFESFVGPDYVDLLFTLNNFNNQRLVALELCQTCDTWAGTMSVTYNFTPSPVPVPAALPLLASAIVGAGVLVRRRKAKKIAH